MSKTLLVAGATGKVGRAFTRALFADPRFSDFRARALCHNRTLHPTDRLEVVSGAIEHREVVEEAFRGVTHVLHLATCKEMPQTIHERPGTRVDGARAGYMRKTPNRVSGIGALRAAERPRPRTARVSPGGMIPSSQRRAVE